MQKILLFFLMFLSHVSYSQYDSLVIYYRELGADYKFINNDIDKIKEFSFGRKLTIDNADCIKKILGKLENLKSYDKPTQEMSPGYLLGAYGYNNGSEDLIFTISSFHRLNYKGSVFLYQHKFLDLLFGKKLQKYY